MKALVICILLAAASLTATSSVSTSQQASTRNEAAQARSSQLAALFNDWTNGTTIPYKLVDTIVFAILYIMWVLFATMITTNASGRRSAASYVQGHLPSIDSTARWVSNALDNWLDHIDHE